MPEPSEELRREVEEALSPWAPRRALLIPGAPRPHVQDHNDIADALIDLDSRARMATGQIQALRQRVRLQSMAIILLAATTGVLAIAVLLLLFFMHGVF